MPSTSSSPPTHILILQVDCIQTLRSDVVWHPDGTFLAVPSKDGDVFLYERFELQSQEPAQVLSGGHKSPVAVMAFSPNGEAEREAIFRD